MEITSNTGGIRPKPYEFGGKNMKQYCRYCAHCFDAGDDFRCSDHPKGEQPHWSRTQINRENHCPNFALSELGDAETGKQYTPRKEKTEADKNQMTIWEVTVC